MTDLKTSRIGKYIIEHGKRECDSCGKSKNCLVIDLDNGYDVNLCGPCLQQIAVEIMEDE